MIIKYNKKTLPICSVCDIEMLVGYVFYDGVEHYCSTNCLYKNYTSHEFNAALNSGLAYWTSWV